MEQFWGVSSFVVSPTRSGAGHIATIVDASGGALGSVDADGSVRDAGAVLLRAPVRYETKRHGPLQVDMDIFDPAGAPLGSGKVVKYGIGPRSKTAHVAMLDPDGAEVTRIEPADKKGEELTVSGGGSKYATVAIAEVKAGFLKKNKVYTVSVVGAVPEAAYPLVLAAITRYDAVLDAVISAAMAKDARN